MWLLAINGLAALCGSLVGLAVVAQKSYASVADRMSESGTLAAMDADDESVGRVLGAKAISRETFGLEARR